MLRFLLDKETLPFAAQMIATLLRLAGWTLDVNTNDNSPPSTNSTIKERLEILYTNFCHDNEVPTERGRLRIEKSTDDRKVKVYLYLGDLRRHPVEPREPKA